MINIYNISGTLISGGLEPEKTSANLKRDLTPSLGWTKSDMRHPHKVTTQMKPLPELEIIPPFSAENKEADVDREKRKMLTNNVSMMQMEVTKICNRFKIPLASLDKDNLDKYPDAAKEKLGLALNCVRNAEVTLTDFLDFLKNEKYKEWNDEQKAKREVEKPATKNEKDLKEKFTKSKYLRRADIEIGRPEEKMWLTTGDPGC